MAKLKLGPLADDKPVKMSVELPANLHWDLVDHAEILGRQSGKTVEDPAKLIVPRPRLSFSENRFKNRDKSSH